jgi:hypothetical protein
MLTGESRGPSGAEARSTQAPVTQAWKALLTGFRGPASRFSFHDLPGVLAVVSSGRGKTPSFSPMERQGWGAPSQVNDEREAVADRDVAVACGLKYSEFVLVGPGVIGANMQGKLFVALQLEVAHHFTEGCAGGRTRRLELPAAFRTPKTAKPRLINPHQPPAHGCPFRCAQVSLTTRLLPACCREAKRSPFHRGVLNGCSRKLSPYRGVTEDKWN